MMHRIKRTLLNKCKPIGLLFTLRIDVVCVFCQYVAVVPRWNAITVPYTALKLTQTNGCGLLTNMHMFFGIPVHPKGVRWGWGQATWVLPLQLKLALCTGPSSCWNMIWHFVSVKHNSNATEYWNVWRRFTYWCNIKICTDFCSSWV